MNFLRYFISEQFLSISNAYVAFDIATLSHGRAGAIGKLGR